MHGFFEGSVVAGNLFQAMAQLQRGGWEYDGLGTRVQLQRGGWEYVGLGTKLANCLHVTWPGMQHLLTTAPTAHTHLHTPDTPHIPAEWIAVSVRKQDNRSAVAAVDTTGGSVEAEFRAVQRWYAVCPRDGVPRQQRCL